MTDSDKNRAVPVSREVLDELQRDAARWREIVSHMVHQRCGPNVGWTIGDLVLQGDSPEEAVDAAIAMVKR